jgi:outer membrane protein assembly factor BamD (BamD/ComL family)
MKRWILAVTVLALAACGAEDRRKKAIEKVDHDQEAIRKAGAAVNEVIRNSPDCEVAKPLIAEAYQRIEDARQEVSVPASQQTLDALKVQVDRVAQVCP